MEQANQAFAGNVIDPLQRQKNELRTIRLALMKAMRDADTWQDVILAADTLNSVNIKFHSLFGHAESQSGGDARSLTGSAR